MEQLPKLHMDHNFYTLYAKDYSFLKAGLLMLKLKLLSVSCRKYNIPFQKIQDKRGIFASFNFNKDTSTAKSFVPQLTPTDISLASKIVPH